MAAWGFSRSGICFSFFFFSLYCCGSRLSPVCIVMTLREEMSMLGFIQLFFQSCHSLFLSIFALASVSTILCSLLFFYYFFS